MSFYSTTNNQTTRKIYNIIDDLQQKLSDRNKSKKKYRVPENSNYSEYNINFTDNINSNYLRSQINSFSNDIYNQQPINTNQSQVIPQNITVNQSSDLEIRKIIREEFNSLISPYQSDLNNNINMLQIKINNISNDFQNETKQLRSSPNINTNEENLKKEIYNILSNYVSYNEYNKKMKELEDQIASNMNNLNLRNNSAQVFNDKFTNEIKNINQSIQELKMKNQENNNKFNNFINNYDNEMTSLKQNYNKFITNEIKLNDIFDKNSFLQKNFEGYKEETNNFKNVINLSLSENNQKINEIENKQNNINEKINDFENRYKKTNEEINNINKNLLDTINSINNLQDKNNNNIDINNINNNTNQINEIKDKIEKMNLNNLVKLDINKIDSINDKYEELMSNNQKLFQVLEQYNTTITDLNTKLNKLREDYEKDSKKKYNQINLRISKVEDESKDQISFRNSTINYNAQKDNDNFRKDINLMKEKLNNFDKKIEEIQNELPIISNYNNNQSPKNMRNEEEMNKNVISNDILNIKEEIKNINNKIVDLENQIISQEIPNIKENIKTINDKMKNNNFMYISQEINNIKNDIKNIDTKLNENNYMITISNLESKINKIINDIQKYHSENENNKIENNLDFGQVNQVKLDNNKKNKDIIDNDEELLSEKDYNNRIKNDNQDMIDIMASGNSKLNHTETFVTMALPKNSVNIDINNDNKEYQNNNINNNNENNYINNESERNINNNNDSISDNRPVGKAPIPTDKEPSDESKNSLDDFDIEDI